MSMSMSFPALRQFQVALAGAIIVTICAGRAADAAVAFSDTFATSTMNAASPAAPTASSTNYAIASSKNGTGSSIAPGDLKVTQASTSSGFIETQALFASTPLSLASNGDYVQLQFTFTNTSRILFGGNSTLNVGLYDSNGTGPVPGGQINNAGLEVVRTDFASGYAAGWTGYVGRIGMSGFASSQIITRPAQTDTTNESQDLLFNNAGTGAYDNPTGVAVGSTGPQVSSLTAGADYTVTFKLTRDASGFVVIDYNLFAGTGTGGTNVFTLSRTTNASQTIATEFDALAIGWRYAGVTGDPASTMDIRSIEVTTNLPVPEPTSLALVGLGAIGLLHRRRPL